MTVSVQQILTWVGYELSDEDAVRWTETEKLAWLNEGQRAVATIRPDSSSAVTSIPLVTGSRQSVPDDGFAFISAVRNGTSSAPGRAVRTVDRTLLDVASPTWHSMTPTDEVRTYSPDPQNPLLFYVYPPADGTGSLEIVYGVIPAEVGTSGNISVNDKYAAALVNYVLYRSYAKDAEFAGNQALADSYYKAFVDAVGAVK